MPIEKHDLHKEFPEFTNEIHELKMNDAHFLRLFEEYHDVDKEVHRIEENIETPSDEFTNARKQRRLELKDELHKMIQKRASA